MFGENQEDDPIEEEIPVYLSKSLAENLYVLQFPIKNRTFSIDRSNITNCCIKPESKQLKIDFKIDTASRNYDAFKGEMFAKIADGNNKASTSHDKNEHPSFMSGRMDKASFVSCLTEENPRYVIAIMEDRGLYLVPVKAFFQMRQTYSYFDKGDKRTKTEKGEMEDEDVEEDLKQVTVKFARSGDNEKIKKAREKSYRFISQIGKDEPWCETLIYPKDSTPSQLERHKVSSINICSDISTGTNMIETEYFENLVNSDSNVFSNNLLMKKLQTGRECSKPEENEICLIDEPISKKHVKKLSLLDQLKIFLRDAKVLSFNNLMELVATPDITAEKVLQNLKLCGVMIRGNWTLQSEIFYPPKYISSINGISSEMMCKGRDYILYKLMKNDMTTLNRQKVASIIQLPHEETREILESVAVLKSNKTWDFLKPPDYEFGKKYPDIYQRQEALWKAQEEKFLEMEAEKNEKRKRTRSIRESKI